MPVYEGSHETTLPASVEDAFAVMSYVEGDLNYLEGRWRFKPAGRGRSTARLERG